MIRIRVMRLVVVTGVSSSETSDGELAAFVSYASAFPAGFLSLVDTYDVIRLATLLTSF